MWLGIGRASVLWLAASILMSVWAVWFGSALARAPVGRAFGVRNAAEHDATERRARV